MSPEACTHLADLARAAAPDWLGMNLDQADLIEVVHANGTYVYVEMAALSHSARRVVPGPIISAVRDGEVMALAGVVYFLLESSLSIEICFYCDTEDMPSDETIETAFVAPMED